MDNLWKKESNAAGALYINLFPSHRENEQIEKMAEKIANMNTMPRCKNNQVSTLVRELGNNFFKAKNWLEAMKWYNRSLSCAEIGSENVALAYLNRSACFLHIKMYDEALKDIELAKSANLPERLLSKLEQRQRECRSLMVTVEKPLRREFKLSYEANKNFPCMADVVEIKHNQEFGRHLVAKCDIPVGRIILVEKEFINTKANNEVCCSTCFWKNANFIACPQCIDALFCDADCMNRNLLHKWECGASWAQLQFDEKFFVHSILMAIESFPNIDTLMEFVESALAEDPETLPTSIHDLKSNYHFFFKLKQEIDLDNSSLVKFYECVASIPEINVLFDCEKKKRFLMHLVTHHYLIIKINANHDSAHSVILFKSVNNVYSMANHSCAPNLFTYCIGDQSICETIRFIRKGEQLCISYLGFIDPGAETAVRQMELKSKWNFVCRCVKCVRTNMNGNVHLVNDPCFQFALSNMYDNRKYSEVLEKCQQFLNEHGHLAWSKEIEAISLILASMISELYIKPLHYIIE